MLNLSAIWFLTKFDPIKVGRLLSPKLNFDPDIMVFFVDMSCMLALVLNKFLNRNTLLKNSRIFVESAINNICFTLVSN